MVLENMASFHATGYHFLQNYKNGVKGFKNDHPDYPRRTDNMTKEEYLESVKEYFKTKGKFHNVWEIHAIRNSSSFVSILKGKKNTSQLHCLEKNRHVESLCFIN